MTWYCKRCAVSLAQDAATCPSCGLRNPVIPKEKIWPTSLLGVAYLGISVIAFYYVRLHEIAAVSYDLLLGGATVGIVAAFLFIFGWRRRGVQWLLTAVGIAGAGLLLAAIL
jgi:hypothetical protein